MGGSVGGLLSAAAPIIGAASGIPGGAMLGSAIGGMFGGQQAGANATSANNAAAAGAQFNPVNVNGAGGTFNFENGQANLGLSDQMQGFQDQLFGQAGSMYGGLSDPSQVAQGFFDQGQSLLAPGQAQQRSSLENRLFSQGRLGSTGGANQFGALMDSQNAQNSQLAMQALGRGTQQRGQEIGQANQLFNQGMGIFDLAGNAANLGSSLGQAGATGGANAAPYIQANGNINPEANALTSFAGAVDQNPGMFSGLFGGPSNMSGIGGVNQGSQQDQMLASQNFGF